MKTPVRIMMCSTICALLTVAAWSTGFTDPHHRFATVPALAVSNQAGKVTGSVHYILIQLDQDRHGRGPTVLFSEQTVGASVGQEWKQGVRTAILAAAKALGEDGADWTVTIRNRSYSSFTEGSSASAAVAVGIMSAWRGDTLRPDVVLSGQVNDKGGILDVDDLPAKLEGATLANMRVMLVPRGQARTPDWNLFEQGDQQHITVTEVGSLGEAYELMIAK